MNTQPFVVDIGGEGRHPLAWNVNPRALKTIGPQKGQPIPRRLPGRGDSVPLADHQADVVIVERTPLSREACEEIRRIARRRAIVVLRHVRAFSFDPHRLAKELLGSHWCERQCSVGASLCQETVFELADEATSLRSFR